MRSTTLCLLAVSCAALVAAGCATTPVPKTPQEYFAEGEALQARGKHDGAIELWKKVRDSFPGPELAARAELGIADGHFATESYIEAAAEYENFRKLHPNHEKTPYALYRLGLSQFLQFDGADRDQTAIRSAAATFESYLRLYPNGEQAGEVRKKLEETNARLAAHELYVARFYLRGGKGAAAAARVEELLRRQPHPAAMDEALLVLGCAYLKNGDKGRGIETIERLLREYPASPFAPDAKKALAQAKDAKLQ